MQIVVENLVVHLHECPRARPARYPLTIGDQTHYLTPGRVYRMSLKLPVNHQVKFTLPAEGLDEFGNRVALATVPVASVSDPSVLSILPDPARPDDPSAGILRAGTVAATGQQFLVTDEDESESPITAIVDVDVPAGPLARLATDTLFGEVEPVPESEIPSP